MKTIRTILFVAFAAISFASCQKELTDPSQTQDTPKKYVTFTGMLDDFEAGTKTTMWYQSNLQEGEKLKTYFMEGDYIMVNGCKSTGVNQKVDEGKHGAEIKFVIPFEEGSAEANPPYYAMTASQCKSYDSETHTYTIEVGKSQTYSRSNSNKFVTHHSQADILAAYTDSEYNAMQFKHMCTFLAITPQEANDVNAIEEEVEEAKDSLKTIYVRQGDGGNIAGTWTLKFNEDNVPYLTPSEMTDIITYNCISPKWDVSAKGLPLGQVVMIAVPAYDYPDGLLITMKDKKGKFASYKIKEAKYAGKGGMIIPFNPEYNPGSGVIKNEQDWEDFAAAINSGDDSKLYRWVGNGTVKLGANIEADNLTSITTKFPYVFDGCGYSIKRNTADQALFSDLTGEIRNLTLDGKLNLTESEGAPFVTNMYAGAKITGCTNNMNVTFALSTHCYVTGFAAVAVRNDTEGPELLEISNCTNNGEIKGTVDVSAASYNTAVAGFIADVRSAVGNFDYDVKLVNCKNTAPITLAPISGTSTTYGMSVCGVAGIIGWCRDIKSLTLNDCDNSGAITVKADNIESVGGLKACVAAAGGIIGVGSTVGSGKISTNGRVYSLNECDNTATIYNCMVNSSAADDIYNKVYTGGLAGVLIGKADKFATVKSCTNTGNVFTYDICSDDNPKPEVVSTSPALCSVVGGFIGVGGNLDLDGCTVDCQIGNGKRPVVAWGGVIGYILKPFKINDMNLKYSGYFQRLSYKTSYKYNRAVIGVPAFVKVNTGTEDEPKYEYEPLDISGSVISGYLKAVGKLMTAGDLKTEGDKTNTKNLVSTLTTPLFNSASKVKSHLLNGGTGDNGATLIKDVDITKLTITYSAN